MNRLARVHVLQPPSDVLLAIQNNSYIDVFSHGTRSIGAENRGSEIITRRVANYGLTAARARPWEPLPRRTRRRDLVGFVFALAVPREYFIISVGAPNVHRS